MSDRVEQLNEFGESRFPGLIGLRVTRVDETGAEGRLEVVEPLIAGTGYVFAPVVVGMADILCAYAMNDHLPPGASFTTVELKTNFLSSARLGEEIVAQSTPVHLGRRTQVWDAEVNNATTGRRMAIFRNTQMILL